MPATPHVIPAATEQNSRQRNSGGAYASIPAPSDQLATCTDVEDYSSNTRGWVLKLDVLGAEFKYWLPEPWSDEYRWKTTKTLDAFGFEWPSEAETLDPNIFINQTVGVRIDWDSPNAQGTRFRKVMWVFPWGDDEPEAAYTEEGPATVAPEFSVDPDEDVPFGEEEPPAL